MKIGKSNKLDNNVSSLSTSTSTPNPGYDLANILDSNTLKIWRSTGTEGSVIEIDLTEPITSSTICLINVSLTDTFEIRTLSAGNQITNSISVSFDNSNGLEYQNMLFQLTNTTDAFNKIQIILDCSKVIQGVGYYAHGYGSVGYGVTSSGCAIDQELSLGYLWCGDVVNLGCSEALQPFDSTNDDVNITRTNNPDVKEEYDFQGYNVTIKKDNDFVTIRNKLRTIMAEGLGNGRPFIVDEPYFPLPEIVYGIFDATKIGYDVFSTGTTTFIAQTTFGIREVF